MLAPLLVLVLGFHLGAELDVGGGTGIRDPTAGPSVRAGGRLLLDGLGLIVEPGLLYRYVDWRSPSDECADCQGQRHELLGGARIYLGGVVQPWLELYGGYGRLTEHQYLGLADRSTNTLGLEIGAGIDLSIERLSAGIHFKLNAFGHINLASLGPHVTLSF